MMSYKKEKNPFVGESGDRPCSTVFYDYLRFFWTYCALTTTIHTLAIWNYFLFPNGALLPFAFHNLGSFSALEAPLLSLLCLSGTV